MEPTMEPTKKPSNPPSSAPLETPTKRPNQTMRPTAFPLLFEGHLTLVFSLYAPGVEYSALESFLSEIFTVLLCSRSNLWLVSSTTDMINECPYQRNLLSPMSIMREVLAPEEDATILWNAPHITNDAQLLEEIQYYAWNFTYPVLQWGEDEEPDLQWALDESISSNRLDRTLPWDNARVSISGQEQITFLLSDESAPTIPHSTAQLLKFIGIGMIALNTLFVVVITHLAKKKKRSKPAPGGALVSHEGVDEMLQTTRQLVSSTDRLVHEAHHASGMVYIHSHNTTALGPRDDDDDESIELSFCDSLAESTTSLSSILKAESTTSLSSLLKAESTTSLSSILKAESTTSLSSLLKAESTTSLSSPLKAESTTSLYSL
jgi:hypothetical protein